MSGENFSVNGWEVTLSRVITRPERFWLESRLWRAKTREEAQLAVDILCPPLRPPCRVCSGRGTYWLDRYPGQTGGGARETVCHSCGGTGRLSPVIVEIIRLLAMRAMIVCPAQFAAGGSAVAGEFGNGT